MSMRSWSECGFGYKLFNGSNFDRVKKFLMDHVDVLCYGSANENKSTLSKCCDEFDIELAIGSYPSTCVANIINSIENCFDFCGFDPCGDCGTDEHFGIPMSFPWDCDSKFRDKDGAIKVLKKYAEQLGIDGDPSEFDLEYFG